MRSIKPISTAGYMVSATFFLLYGPLLWLFCQNSCGNTDRCTNYIGIGMFSAMLIVLGIGLLFISLVLDIIAFYRIKRSGFTRRTIWLNGSSIFGIIVCVISFILSFTGTIPYDNCTTWSIHAIILSIITFVPPIFAR